MALIDKYFSTQETRKTITVCNDTILVGAQQFTREALIEAIEVIGETILNHKMGVKTLGETELINLMAKQRELIIAAKQNNLIIGTQFRTVGK